jgi:hypothetical protein
MTGVAQQQPPHRMTAEEAVAALRVAVEEYGAGYVYPDDLCWYVRHGKPACLVGVALHRAGVVTVGTLTEWDHLMIGELADVCVEVLDPAAVRVMMVAQSAQDSGFSWGAALARAEAVMAR